MRGLSASQQRETCFHEAGHAVIFALGGINVFGVAVAPAGAQAWRTPSSSGRVCSDLWGLCRKSELILPRQLLRWLMSEGALHPDGRGHEAILRTPEGQILLAALNAQQQREIRAQMVGLLAGPAAEQMHRGDDVCLQSGDELEDFARAAALATLIPAGADLSRLLAFTTKTLQKPEIWQLVTALAGELERTGEVAQRIKAFLPTALPDWPPACASQG